MRDGCKYFTSESVGEGHPDKLCDQISDGILDACLRVDPNAKVAIETAVKTNMVSDQLAELREHLELIELILTHVICFALL